MIKKELIKYSFQNLRERKSRSLLTTLSILIGITTIFIFVSFGLGLYGYINELSSSGAADKIILQSRAGFGGIDSTFGFTEDELEAVEKTSGVFDASGAYFKAAQIEYNNEKKYVFLIGYDPKKPLVMQISNVDIFKGDKLSSRTGKKIVLGYNYLLENKIFSRAVSLGDKVNVNGVDFQVVGFLEEVGTPQDDSQIYLTSDSFKELYPNEVLLFNMVIARVELDHVDDTIKRVEKTLRDKRGQEEGKEDFFVASFQSLIEGYSTALNIVVGFVVLIALISVVVSAVNTANTMITSVLERYKEIGIMKSIGAKNRDIFTIFLFESGFLGFVAGAIGVLIGFILSFIGGTILKNIGYGFLQPLFSPWLFVGCILFATLTGAISGIIPAIRAAKINPVEALRYE